MSKAGKYTNYTDQEIHDLLANELKNPDNIREANYELQSREDLDVNKNVTEGGQLFDSVVNPEALKSLMDSRSAEKKEIAARRRDQSRGLNARENAAARAAFESQIARAGAGARRQVAANIASRNLRGGVAGAQRRAVESDIAGKRIDAGRNLLLQDIALRNTGLTNYEKTLNDHEENARQHLQNRLKTGLTVHQQKAAAHAAIQNARLARK